jgi:hypothetical protein
MIEFVLNYIEDTDPVFLSILAFSAIFFTIVITMAVKEVKRKVRKEKAIRKLENRYDNLCQHRSNLIVSSLFLTAFSTTITGRRRMGRPRVWRISRIS